MYHHQLCEVRKGDFSSLAGKGGVSSISQYIHAAKFLSNSSLVASYVDLMPVTMTFSSSIFSGCICMPFCTGGLINFFRSTGGKNHLDQSQWIYCCDEELTHVKSFVFSLFSSSAVNLFAIQANVKSWSLQRLRHSKSSNRGFFRSLKKCSLEPGCKEMSGPFGSPFLYVEAQFELQAVFSSHARACF
jgi:hypothetical protein